MWSARVTKDKRDQRKRSHIYVALDVSDQDKIFGAAVANVSVDRDGTVNLGCYVERDRADWATWGRAGCEYEDRMEQIGRW